MIEKYLGLLSEVTKSLTTSFDLNETLSQILMSFSKFLGLNRGSITLLDQETKTASIVASYGLSKKEKSRGTYRIGEGITGYVQKTGKSVIIPVIAEDPRFLNKTGSRKNKDNLSFLCVPIRQGRQIIGALSVDRDYKKNHSLDNDLQVLRISTRVIAHILKMQDLREVERSELVEENKKLRSELQRKFQFSEIIGHSDKMFEVLKLLSQVTKSNATVMIRGESGTGKELFANALHYNSLRSDKPFIKVNCSAMPDSLLESELFGYEKGAFTGAVKSKAGKFELAQGGTIFLDEIGDFPLSTQVKLLRVLQSREVERLGSNKTISLDVRVVVATNRELEKEMENGSFREDLYYRINVFPIFVPPLRKRKTDILMLAEHFLEKHSMANNKSIRRISTPAINMLMSYHWPGNVRELENCIERAILVCDGDAISGNHLPPTLQIAENNEKKDFRGLSEAVSNLEQEMILEALKRHHGSQRHAAKELKLTERILGYKIKRYNIIPKFYTSK